MILTLVSPTVPVSKSRYLYLQTACFEISNCPSSALGPGRTRTYVIPVMSPPHDLRATGPDERAGRSNKPACPATELNRYPVPRAMNRHHAHWLAFSLFGEPFRLALPCRYSLLVTALDHAKERGDTLAVERRTIGSIAQRLSCVVPTPNHSRLFFLAHISC